jgi:ketosteroid isomerase-like protein
MTRATDIGPMEAVRRFVDAFNRNEIALAMTACADEMTIIDDFAPYQWSGTGAAAAWSRDMAGMASKYGMSTWSVGLDEPRMEVVSDRGAYLVVPIDVRWLQDGSAAERRGFMTLALREDADGWRISMLAWTWR